MPTFTATLNESDLGHWVEVPFDGREEFGKARARVQGTVNGVEFRTTLSVHERTTYLTLREDVRDDAGLSVGDEVEVTLESDEEE